MWYNEENLGLIHAGRFAWGHYLCTAGHKAALSQKQSWSSLYLPLRGSNGSSEAVQNESKCNAQKVSWREPPELLLPRVSQRWRYMALPEQNIQNAQTHQSTYFQLLGSRLPPTHAHKCMFYISPCWDAKTKAHSCVQAHTNTWQLLSRNGDQRDVWRVSQMQNARWNLRLYFRSSLSYVGES